MTNEVPPDGVRACGQFCLASAMVYAGIGRMAKVRVLQRKVGETVEWTQRSSRGGFDLRLFVTVGSKSVGSSSESRR